MVGDECLNGEMYKKRLGPPGTSQYIIFKTQFLLIYRMLRGILLVCLLHAASSTRVVVGRSGPASATTPSAANQSVPMNPSDKTALVQLRDAQPGSPCFASWDGAPATSATECDWPGVTCSAAGQFSSSSTTHTLNLNSFRFMLHAHAFCPCCCLTRHHTAPHRTALHQGE